MSPIAYFNMIKAADKGFRFGVRRQMVLEALEQGTKPTARRYCVTVKTLRKWVKRYKADGLSGLEERSRAPKRIPHKTPVAKAKRVIACKKKLKGMGVKRMVAEFDLGVGETAATRILREKGLLKRRKKKRLRRNDLRAEKARYRVGEVICMDTKDLTDIPAYWTQMMRLGLPRWQYTWRDVKSGVMFLGYANERSLQHSTIFSEIIMSWLTECRVNCEGSRWQTDAGSEFIGSWQSKKKSAYIRALEEYKIAHAVIPKVTYNADVETVHHTIELEFFDIERFRSREDFMIKVSTYQRWYNMVRKNGSKGNKSPFDLISECEPAILPKVVSLPAIDLDALLRERVRLIAQTHQGGYHVPALAQPQ